MIVDNKYTAYSIRKNEKSCTYNHVISRRIEGNQSMKIQSSFTKHSYNFFSLLSVTEFAETITEESFDFSWNRTRVPTLTNLKC